MPGLGHRAGLLILALLAPGGYSQHLFLQATPAPNPQNQRPRHSITGTVTNASTGEPVRRALVRLWGTRTATALTGLDGRFEIDDVPEGPINLQATKPGFFDASSLRDAHSDPALPGQRRQNTSAMIVGSGSNDFPLTLYPAGRIIGRVTDPDGEPVEQTQIQVFAEQIFNGHKQWQQRNATVSDDDGQYRIGDLTPGRYFLYAMGHALPALSSNAAPEVTAPLYYPEARDRASAQPIEVGPGQEFHADFHVRSERGFQIAGTLSGYPAQLGVSFSILNESGQNVFFGGVNVDQSHGRFVAPAVPSGTWILSAVTIDREGHAYQARQQVAVNGVDISDLPLVLHPTTSIPVIINHPDGQPAPAQQVGPVRTSAFLMPADSSTFQQYGMVWHPEQAAGSIDNVQQGKYKLVLQSFGNECVDSAWYGNIDLLRDYLVVTSGGATTPININMRSDCASIEPRNAPGVDQASGFLVVFATSSTFEPRTVPITMINGGHTGLTLSPGTYQIYAFTTLDDLEYANPEVLREYPSQTVTLDPGQKLQLTVKLTEPKGQ